MSQWVSYDATAEDARHAAGSWWWLFLCTGILWLVVAMVLLRFNLRSVFAIGLMGGVVMIVAGINELMALSVVPGWKWLHAVLGVLFVITGILCFAYPGRTFVILASLFGWFLLFKGTFDVLLALLNRHANDLWWLQLVVGILEIALAFWASGYFAGSAFLLIVWIGIGALLRGITEIILAFTLRKLGKQAEEGVLATS